MDNIVLCGFMGSGKSTVGAALAQLLNRDFVDMDALIVKETGLSVSEIFKQFGEPHFRTLETRCAGRLAERGGLVIAPGGGALLSPQNERVLKTGGIIVLLDVPLEIIRRRLAGDETRPLLDGANRGEKLAFLYKARMNAYRAAADVTVRNTDDRPAEAMAREIAAAIGLETSGRACPCEKKQLKI